MNPQKLEVNMYVARAQKDAVETLSEMRDVAVADETSEDECQDQKSNVSYYAAHVVPRCEDAFWEKLYQSFNTHVAHINHEAPIFTAKKKTLDLDNVLDAETTCGSGSSDTDTTQGNLFSTDSEMKASGLTSCDEVSEVDSSTGKMRSHFRDQKNSFASQARGAQVGSGGSTLHY